MKVKKFINVVVVTAFTVGTISGIILYLFF